MIKKLILKKELTILISIIILILSISSVSANDDLLISELNEETDDLLINDLSDANESFVIDSENLTMYYKNGSRYGATLTDSNGTGISNITIEFEINSVTYNRTTNRNGTADMAINLDPGIYTVTSTYYGPSNNYTSISTLTILSTIVGDNVVKYYYNDTHFYASFYDGLGNPLSKTNVSFNINGVLYTRETGENGIAKLSIYLNPDFYILTAEHPDTGLKMSYNITVLATLFGEDLVKYYKNNSQYSVKVLDGEGNPLAYKNITMNINGIIYHRETNEHGIAILSINLAPGEYIITVYHPDTGLEMSNNITVLATLFGENLVKYYKNDSQYYVNVLDSQGNALANRNVTMNINGIFYEKETNDDGTATLAINLVPGEYIITVYHPDTTLQHSNNITVLSKLITHDLKYELNYPTLFYVTVLDDEGNPHANQEVTLSVGGKSLTKVTDETGLVSFNITARSGVYDISTTHDGYSVQNTLEVYRDAGGFERFNLGSNNDGSVSVIKSVGNPESDVRIAYIIGVHPSENAVHTALYDQLLAKATELNYCYDIYRVNVVYNGDYANDRMKGQLLAQEFVVPEIISKGYNMAIDVHSNEGTVGGNYLHTNFAFAPMEDTISKNYATKIINENSNLVQYFPESQTSPEYVTIPIAQSGTPTIIYEAYKFEAYSKTVNDVDKLITSVDTINF